jgi:hypothetical protein
MHISTNEVSSVMLRLKKLEIRINCENCKKKNNNNNNNNNNNDKNKNKIKN